MPRIQQTVSRSTLKTVARSAVLTGQVFRVMIKGVMGKKTYIALGHNGKSFSINTANGELASTSKKDKAVTVVGKAIFRTQPFDPLAQGRVATRGTLGNSDVFKVNGGEKTYLNLGKLKDGRYVSVNAGKAMGEDYAVTDNGRSEVQVLSTWSAEVQLAA